MIYTLAQSGDAITAATWNKSSFDAGFGSSNTTLTTSGVISTTFTAPSTSDSFTGCWIFIASKPSDVNTVSLVLRESGADVATTSTTINGSDIVGNNVWIYFRLATPYTYTTTSSGAYAIKASVSSSSAAGSVRSGSTGSLAIIVTDSRTGVPSLGSDQIFMGPHNCTTSLTLTVSGTFSFGASLATGLGDTAVITNSWHAQGAATAKVSVEYDPSVDTTLTFRGPLYFGANTEFYMGKTTDPIVSGKLAKLVHDQNGTSVNYGMSFNGRFHMQGQPKTSWKSTYVSGTGTAADPLITESDIGEVGDEVDIAPTDSYNHTDTRFIKTKNSSTSYVLSSTKSGAEAALSYTHTTGAHIVNVERNVIITTNSTSQGTYIFYTNSTEGEIDIDWGRYENTGSVTPVNRNGIYFTSSVASTAQVDNTVFTNALHRSFVFQTSTSVGSHTGLIVRKANTTNNGTGVSYFTASKNRTFSDCYWIDGTRSAIQFSTAYSHTFNDCIVAGFNTTSNSIGAIEIANSGVITFNSLTMYQNRVRGLRLSNATDVIFTNGSFGELGDNSVDIDVVADTYNTGLFDNTISASTSMIDSDYLLMIPGSIIKFHNLNATDNNHRNYTVNGVLRSTGEDLDDTNIRTSNSLAVGLYPETGEGRTFQFGILARPGRAVNVIGFVWGNSTFVSDTDTSILVELYLPNNSVAAVSQTMTKTSDPNSTNAVFNLAAQYNGSVTALATLKITAKNPNATSGAYAYVDDVFNGTNPFIALDVWQDGEPSKILFEQLGDAAAVWNIATSTLTTAGTTGKRLADGLTRNYWEGNR